MPPIASPDPSLKDIALAASAIVDATREVRQCNAREGYVNRDHMLDWAIRPRRESAAVGYGPLRSPEWRGSSYWASSNNLNRRTDFDDRGHAVHSSLVQIARAVSEAAGERGVLGATSSNQGRDVNGK